MFVDILKEATLGSISSAWRMALIIVPLMIAMEVLKDLGVLDAIAHFFSPVVKIFGMKKESGFPMLVGLFIGISYGAGIIFQATKEGDIPKRDIYLIIYFLVAAHAIFEDTAIFMAVGVNPFILGITRVIFAFLFTYVVSKIIKDEDITQNIDIK